jgi:hypothetical protein
VTKIGSTIHKERAKKRINKNKKEKAQTFEDGFELDPQA